MLVVIECAYDIMNASLNKINMSKVWCVHEETSPVNCTGDLRASQSEIPKSANKALMKGRTIKTVVSRGFRAGDDGSFAGLQSDIPSRWMMLITYFFEIDGPAGNGDAHGFGEMTM
jgi:hypothetical protein